ncbi:MAG: HAD family hydrolase [Lachnospiraceae bacterium]|nr:HAD family hydrolase [Lachnospiraceae bacterium]
MQHKAVIFDMDGTILDTLDDLADSVNHSLQLQGFPKRKREEIRAFLGNGMIQLIHLSVPEGTSPEEEAGVLEEHKKYYPLHSAEKTKAYEGIPELLKVLKQKGIKTAVVSNKSDPNVKALVNRYFDGLFDASVGSREGIPRKPAADLVDIALKELGVEKQEAVYIGDSDVDLATAFHSGLEMITVLWGFRDRDVLEKAGAVTFANTAKELEEMLLL